jgi:hypothetical protein
MKENKIDLSEFENKLYSRNEYSKFFKMLSEEEKAQIYGHLENFLGEVRVRVHVRGESTKGEPNGN